MVTDRLTLVAAIENARSLQGAGALGQADSMIALFTDFGLHGPYTGQMKAVLHQMAPGIPAVDLLADAPVGNPKASAYLLAVYAGWFPAGTVFLCVVDPGVGGARPSIILEADGRWYVGPGNGLFEMVQRRAKKTRSWGQVAGHSPTSTAFSVRFLTWIRRLAASSTKAWPTSTGSRKNMRSPQSVDGSRERPNERTCHDQLKSEEVPCFVSRAGFGNGRVVEDRPKR
jgi:hypothetical protein